MSEEQRADALARWLDEPPGTPAPDDLDPDVVESVLALRPERAPAPRVSLDDILDSVTTGPLAASGTSTADGGDGEVVPFPGSADPLPEAPTPTGSWWTAANRWGGLGVIVATAATLLLVALPLLPGGEQAPMAGAREAEVAGAPPAEQPAADKEASSPAPAPSPAPPPQSMAEALPKVRPPAPKPAQRVVAQKPAAPPKDDRARRIAEPAPIEEAELDAVADLDSWDDGIAPEPRLQSRVPYEMGTRGGSRGDAPIAELGNQEEAAAAQGYAYEPLADEVATGSGAGGSLAAAEQSKESEKAKEAAYAEDARAAEQQTQARLAKREERKASSKSRPAAPAVAEPSAGAPPPSAPAMATPPSPRAQAVPSDLGTSWRHGLDGVAAQRIDEANAQADAAARAGDPRGAAELLLPTVTAPGPAGQVQAARAVQLYLQASDLTAALAVARQGLALDASNTPARSWLLVVYGDALHASGDSLGAQQAWLDAAALNAAR